MQKRSTKTSTKMHVQNCLQVILVNKSTMAGANKSQDIFSGLKNDSKESRENLLIIVDLAS